MKNAGFPTRLRTPGRFRRYLRRHDPITLADLDDKGDFSGYFRQVRAGFIVLRQRQEGRRHAQV